MGPPYIWLSDRIIRPELTVIFVSCFLQVALQGWTLTRKHTVHRLCAFKISSKRHQGKNPSIYEGKFNFPFYFYFSCNQCRTLKAGSILFAMHDVLKGIRRFIALLVMLIGKTCWNSLWKFQMTLNGKTIISHVYFTNIGTFTLPESENGYKTQWDSVLVSLSLGSMNTSTQFYRSHFYRSPYQSRCRAAWRYS